MGAAIVWGVLVARQRSARARRTEERWAHFAETCPAGPEDLGAAYPLMAPGLPGEVAVADDGLCLRLERFAGRTFWLAWPSIRGLDPDPDGGALLRLAGGIDVHLSALACRAIWEAQARMRRPQAPSATAS